MADGLLAVAPDAILGLIWKADCLSVKGEPRAAAPFYSAALKAGERATAATGPLPEPTQVQLDRVAQELENIQRNYDAYLVERLEKAGSGPDRRSPQFDSSLRYLFGAEQPQIEKQRPRIYYYPGLPQRNLYEREDFDWTDKVEEATDAIRAELEALDPADFQPYSEEVTGQASRDIHGMRDNADWSCYFLSRHGEPIAEHVERCPHTSNLVASLPQSRIPTQSPTVMFAKLAPGAKIAPQNGNLNCRLICHLPLVVPGSCGISVAAERREWEEGKLVILDDSIGNELWNDSDEEAVILLFDIARPEIDEQDHRAIATFFKAVDEYR